MKFDGSLGGRRFEVRCKGTDRQWSAHGDPLVVKVQGSWRWRVSTDAHTAGAATRAPAYTALLANDVNCAARRARPSAGLYRHALPGFRYDASDLRDGAACGHPASAVSRNEAVAPD